MNIPELQHRAAGACAAFARTTSTGWAAISADPEVTRWVGDDGRPDAARRPGAGWRTSSATGSCAASGSGRSSSATPASWSAAPACSGPRPGPASRSAGSSRASTGAAASRPRPGRASIEWAREELGADHIISLIEDAQRALRPRRREARHDRRGPHPDRQRGVRGAHLRDRFGNLRAHDRRDRRTSPLVEEEEEAAAAEAAGIGGRRPDYDTDESRPARSRRRARASPRASSWPSTT